MRLKNIRFTIVQTYYIIHLVGTRSRRWICKSCKRNDTKSLAVIILVVQFYYYFYFVKFQIKFRR